MLKSLINIIDKASLSTIIMALGITYVFAQDAQFTQFYANPLYLNPAFAGTDNCPRVILNYRNQWPGLNGTYVNTAVSFDQHIKKIAGGVGIQIVNDRAGEGTLNTNRISLQYAYALNISRNFTIRFGGEASYLQKKLDWTGLTFSDQIDSKKGFFYTTNEIPNGNGVRTVDFSSGILGYSETYYFGVAVHHLFEPNESVVIGESPLPRKYTAHIGVKYKISDFKYGSNSSSYVSPNIMYHLQGEFQQLLVGLYMSYGPFIGGLWYRNQDSFAILSGVQAGKLKFGYSVDITVSRLTMQTGGSHEISITYNLDCKPEKRKFRTISCPTF